MIQKNKQEDLLEKYHREKEENLGYCGRSNLKRETRGKYKTKVDVQQTLKDIYSLMDTKADWEIQEILHIPNSTFYRLKSQLYKDAREQWQKEVKEGLEIRYLQLHGAINFAIKINHEIANNPNASESDRSRSAQALVELPTKYISILNNCPLVSKQAKERS